MNDGVETLARGLGTAPVVAALKRVRSRARGLLVLRKLSVLVGAAVAIAILGAVLDYLVLMPRWLRMGLWAGGVAGLTWAVWRFVLPAWRFSPDLHEVALRLERSEAGRAAGLEGVLTSGLELSGPREGTPSAGRWMADRVVERAMAGFKNVRPASILMPGATRARLAMLGALLVGLTALWAAQPALTTTGALRVLTPWADSAWPKRTEVVDATGVRVHPLGTGLLLRAGLTRTDQPPGGTTVAVRYRVIDGGTPGPTRRLLMTAQPRPIQVAGRSGEPLLSAERFDRLIEPGSLAPAGESDEEQTRELEYWFETADDSTSPARVLLIQPPAVIGATGEVEPPAYASGGAGAAIVSGRVDMGPGNDDRAALGPVLAGSQVRLTIRLNKSVPGPTGSDPDSMAKWALRTFGSAELGQAVVPPAAGKESATLSLRFAASESVRLPVIVSDDHGLTNTDETVYTVDVVKDRAPTATVIEPREDEAVLATAEIGIQGEGRDDAGLRWVSLERQWARPPAGSIGAAAEAMGQPAEFARQETGDSRPVQARASAMLDLRSADEKLRPGDEVWIFALAQDTYSIGDESHPPTRSMARRMRVISADQFVEQIRGQLAQVRETAKALDTEQSQTSRSVRDAGLSPEASARQAAVTDRLGAQTRTIREMIERTERNNLADEALTALLNEARRLSAQAANSSAAASDSMAGGNHEKAQDQQAKVRDDLGRLIELLDRGQDAWLSKRDLQRLVEDQKALAAQTKAATDATIGKSSSDLAEQEARALQAIADRQRDLAQRARQAIDDLNKKSDALAQRDAVQADAMKQAADRGQRQNVPDKMKDAAESAEENRGQQAQSDQQEAVEALEEMLQDLDNAAKNRDQALRRVLASLVETLRGLVRRQTDELAALGRAGADGPFDGLDSGMIRLNQGTLAAASEAREQGMSELGPIADLIDQAAEAQGGAIGALRARPVDVAGAAAGEDVSLTRLKEALAEAEKQKEDAEQRENDRQRRELKAAYRAILETQVALKEETATYLDKALTRKQAAGVRRLGERQEVVRRDLATVRDKTVAMAEAGVFQFAHKRLDGSTGSAARRLGDALADRKTGAMQASAVRVLQSLIESLDGPRPKADDPFRKGEEEEGGGGGGGSGQPEPVIPDMAELLLLRSLQQEAADSTRTADEGGAAPDEVEAVGQLQRDLAEQGARLIEKLESGGRPDVHAPDAGGPAGQGDEPSPAGEPEPAPEERP